MVSCSTRDDIILLLCCQSFQTNKAQVGKALFSAKTGSVPRETFFILRVLRKKYFNIHKKISFFLLKCSFFVLYYQYLLNKGPIRNTIYEDDLRISSEEQGQIGLVLEAVYG